VKAKDSKPTSFKDTAIKQYKEDKFGKQTDQKLATIKSTGFKKSRKNRGKGRGKSLNTLPSTLAQSTMDNNTRILNDKMILSNKHSGYCLNTSVGVSLPS